MPFPSRDLDYGSPNPLPSLTMAIFVATVCKKEEDDALVGLILVRDIRNGGF